MNTTKAVNFKIKYQYISRYLTLNASLLEANCSHLLFESICQYLSSNPIDYRLKVNVDLNVNFFALYQLNEWQKAKPQQFLYIYKGIKCFHYSIGTQTLIYFIDFLGNSYKN